MTDTYKDPGSGILTVVVRTGGGALPIEGAVVTVQGENLTRTLYTDRDGRTVPLSLPTPMPAQSLAPGGARPYAIYDILVEKEGYYRHENRGAPIFPGVTSVQGVEMIPLSPYGGGVPPAGNTDFDAGQNLNQEG